MKHHETLSKALVNDIKRLSTKHSLSLWNKLEKEENITTFCSTLMEAHYGLFFDKTCCKLKYDHKAFPSNELTPDFVISQNGQDIIVDVYHLNSSNEDQRVGKNNSEILWTTLQSITIKPQKLWGANGKVIEKVEKYGPLAESANQPFLICLTFDFLSGLDASDLYCCLYGRSIERRNYNENTGIPFFDLSTALYYSNEKMKKNVSGVLLRTFDSEYIYFHNYSCYNRLNSENLNWLHKFQYEEGDTRR